MVGSGLWVSHLVVTLVERSSTSPLRTESPLDEGLSPTEKPHSIRRQPCQRSPHTLGTQPLAAELRKVAATWSRSQHRLVVLAAEFADSAEWVLDGSPTAAHWLAAVADVEACTTREWIRIGRLLRSLPATADAFQTGRLSYTKVRTLTRIATTDNETELVAIAEAVPASQLGRELAAWLNQNSSPEDIEDLHRRQRSIKWRTDPDGMVTFTLRLPPLLAGTLIAMLTTLVMRSTRRPPAVQTRPQTAIPPWPNNTSTRSRRSSPTGPAPSTPKSSSTFALTAPPSTTAPPSPPRSLNTSPYNQTQHTIIEELQLRCAPCHQNRHRTTE